MSVLFLRATLLLLALTFVSADEDHEYTNDFAVEIDGDMSVADLVAGTHNLRVVRQVRFQTVCENAVATNTGRRTRSPYATDTGTIDVHVVASARTR